MARLAPSHATWEAYAAQPAGRIRSSGDFPHLPLDHPLQSTAHMLFPRFWTKVHPEHERFDAGFDLPDCFLPEYPPAMYLSTHPELGDVSRGVEIAYGNYFDMFNGVLTPEQLDGLRLMVAPFPTAWFNATDHRATCFRCHVNGHTHAPSNWPPIPGQTMDVCA